MMSVILTLLSAVMVFRLLWMAFRPHDPRD
jgi:hypothetical protein